MSDLNEKRKRVQITQGMANAMKGNTARVCSSCSLSVPKYPGRYPSSCPSCGGSLVKPRGERKVYNECEEEHAPVVPVSFVPRIQRVIESGVVGEVAGDDPSCSRVRTVPFKLISETVPGGVRGLQMFLEQAPNGRLYRMEGLADPILVFEFDSVNERLHVWATEEPIRVIGFDPREEVVEALPSPASIGSVSGAAAQVTRKSTMNPNRPGGAHRAVGGTRFEIGHNRNQGGRTDIERSLQNARNSRRGLAGRIQAARDFHASSDGKRLHRDLARFNKGNHKGQPLGPGSPSQRTTFGQLPVPSGSGQLESVGVRFSSKDAAFVARLVRDASAKHSLAASRSGVGFSFKEYEHTLAAFVATVNGMMDRYGLELDADDIGSGQSGRTYIRILHVGAYVTNYVVAAVVDRDRDMVQAQVLQRNVRAECIEEATVLQEGPGTTTGPGILPTQGGAYPEQETLDDLLDACLRKLITIESQDLLQDIEVTREGAIFFYVDPSASEQEVAEVLQALQQADQTITLVGTPDARLQGEQYPAQWWVFTLPPKQDRMLPGPPPPKDEQGEGDQPPPEDKPGDGEPPKQQTVVQGKTAIDQLASEIDTTKLVYSVGESIVEIAPMDEAAADEILRQLRASGPFVHGTWGAKNIYSFEGGKGLQFDARGKRVLVKLNGHDLYDITFGSTRGLKWQVLKQVTDIDAENLARVIDDFLMRGR